MLLPANQTATQSVQHPALIGAQPRTITPVAALSDEPEITDTGAVNPCTQQAASGSELQRLARLGWVAATAPEWVTN